MTVTTAPRSERDPAAALRSRRVTDVMSDGLITCDTTTSLLVVARIMARARIHCIVVEGIREDRDWAILSDLDLVTASALGAHTQTAGEAAVSEPVTVSADETVERAAQLMAEHEISHLVVVDPRRERPVGVVSTLDVARALSA